MEVLLAVVSVFARATGDICVDPIEGGVGDPLFCRVEPDVRLETPYFSIDTHPQYLVGVDSDGERTLMQETPLKEQASIRIRVVPSTIVETEPKRWGGCAEFALNGATGLQCNRSGNEVVWREYFLRRGGVALVVDLSGSQLGESSLVGLNRLFQTLEIHEPR